MTPLRRSGTGLRAALAALVLALPATGAHAESAVLREVHRLGLPSGIAALERPTAVAVSPDGAHLYVVGGGSSYYASNGHLAVLRLDAGAAGFELIQTLADGVDGVDGLAGSIDVQVSPDGAHVYVGAAGDRAIAVFSRDPGTGALTFVARVLTSYHTRLLVSADGAHLYAAGGGSWGLAVFARDAVSGLLTSVEELRDGTIGGGGQFFIVGLRGPSGMVLSPDGQFLYVAASTSGAVTTWQRDAVTGRLTWLEAEFDGYAGQDGLGGAYDVALSPDGSHVYVAGIFDDAVVTFARDAVTGLLTYAGAIFDEIGGVDGLNGVRDIVVAGDGQYVYTLAGSDVALAVFQRDPGTGALTFVEREIDGVNGADGLLGNTGLAQSPLGDRLFVVAEYDRSLAAYTRDPGTGDVAFERMITTDAFGLVGASALAISPDDAYLYLASPAGDGLGVLARDPVSGVPSLVQIRSDGVAGVDGLDGASGLAITTDGAHVYATGATDDAVALFTRDALTGEVAFVSAVRDGAGGFDGLDGARAPVLGPGGAQLYVAGYDEDAVAVLARDAGTGALSPLQVLRDGAAGGTSLLQPTALAVTPDGEHVLALTGAPALVVFARDGGTGLLTLAQEIVGLEGLTYARALAVSDDGASVYVGGSYVLLGFARDPATGALTLADTLVSAAEGVGDLGWISSLVASPVGDRLYAASSNGAVHVFSRHPATGALTPAGSTYGNAWSAVLAVSHDGRYVHAAPDFYEEVVTFAVDTLCPPAPRADCRLPGAPAASSVNLSRTGAGRLVWKWYARGEPTVGEDFVHPYYGAHYAVCGYDGSSALVFRAIADGVWRSGRSLKMKNRYRTPDGVDSLTLSAPEAGRASIKAKAKGPNLSPPPLPLVLPFRLQLVTDTGPCWEAVFSTTTRNDGEAATAIGD